MKLGFRSCLLAALALPLGLTHVARADEAADRKAEIQRKKDEAKKQAADKLKAAEADKQSADAAAAAAKKAADAKKAAEDAKAAAEKAAAAKKGNGSGGASSTGSGGATGAGGTSGKGGASSTATGGAGGSAAKNNGGAGNEPAPKSAPLPAADIEALRKDRPERRKVEVERLRKRWGNLLADPKGAADLKNHSRRVAFLQRARVIADAKKDKKNVELIDQLLTQEDERHGNAMNALREGALPSGGSK